MNIVITIENTLDVITTNHVITLVSKNDFVGSTKGRHRLFSILVSVNITSKAVAIVMNKETRKI